MLVVFLLLGYILPKEDTESNGCTSIWNRVRTILDPRFLWPFVVTACCSVRHSRQVRCVPSGRSSMSATPETHPTSPENPEPWASMVARIQANDPSGLE